MAEYTPAGRPQSFTLPATTDSANLITILQTFADDTMNAHGDTVTGNYTITGTVNMSAPQKAGAALQTAAEVTSAISGTVGVMKVVTSGTRPGSPATGQMIYETDTKKNMQWSGTAWVELGGADGIVATFLFGGL